MCFNLALHYYCLEEECIGGVEVVLLLSPMMMLWCDILITFRLVSCMQYKLNGVLKEVIWYQSMMNDVITQSFPTEVESIWIIIYVWNFL